MRNVVRNAHAAALDFERYIKTQEFEQEIGNGEARNWNYELRNMPRIPLASIESKQDVTDRWPEGAYFGLLNAGLVIGNFNGSKVFVKKISDRFEGDLSLESHFTELLSHLELGPRFIGIITEGGTPTGIITEHVNGKGLYSKDLKDQNRVQRISRFLSRIGFDAIDLQFRLDHQGRLWIVNLGRFVTKNRNLRNLESFTSAMHEARRDLHDSGE